ncbi:non-heme iron oxygenase ferredoxin subunit [Propionicimonas sp.]|jgi:3-phenylpropionate/trans-cinnamate dioxygenase ferredoxin subunit|uniref:Rieske (2Fe-2S) protein n=1 Tax=Propionicimonas sp. TaxID=1955623 RepID=UPI0017C357EB|nr:non-heme iron oxygenase ferredoxin subunit [Propionicimonas sp.]MBU3977593.1 non-heme iron oxygenase ferredoxin subunit [Actinomycetota bacterium]MBA3021518.1 non-heme iron oxygenase ferredoxin subunit [Propionicimonas sp.]MBU3987067.1 non-heme iron oxygenase ferredoxin subunit [Actinomycetota bacterium]MBU4008888.1 non-heme iron oxygenase ferredoxin subunit [Actinomycetota bacterium]MBU4065962.1 non-heme iron oxygenase ferredoxin subunit [Actinomycetota bacterium]
MSFVRACALADVPVGTVLAVEVAGRDSIAIANTTGGLFAIRDVCSHAEIPLSDGEIDGCTLECEAHGSRFDLRTGNPLDPPAVMPVPIYPVRTDGTNIFIDPDNPIESQE